MTKNYGSGSLGEGKTVSKAIFGLQFLEDKNLANGRPILVWPSPRLNPPVSVTISDYSEANHAQRYQCRIRDPYGNFSGLGKSQPDALMAALLHRAYVLRCSVRQLDAAMDLAIEAEGRKEGTCRLS